MLSIISRLDHTKENTLHVATQHSLRGRFNATKKKIDIVAHFSRSLALYLIWIQTPNHWFHLIDLFKYTTGTYSTPYTLRLARLPQINRTAARSGVRFQANRVDSSQLPSATSEMNSRAGRQASKHIHGGVECGEGASHGLATCFKCDTKPWCMVAVTLL